MPAFSVERIRNLLAASEAPCVSIYMPTNRGGPAVQQNPIRLKNALALAEEQLLTAGRRRREVEDFLRPARGLLDLHEFWWRQAEGFAVFLSPQTLQPLRLTISFRDLVVVGERFHLKPLLPLLVGDGRFYILALSPERVRLLEASRDSARVLDVPRLPTRLEEGVNWDVKQHHFQKQLRAPRSTTERSEVFDAILEPFLLRVESTVTDHLQGQHAPLLLAGVRRICSCYRRISKHEPTLEPGIDGNADELDEAELHRRAWQIVQPIFQSTRQRTADRYCELLGSGRTGNDLREVLCAAHDGRVEALFVLVDENQWGIFVPETREVEYCNRRDSEDLLDRTALEVLLRRGVVYAVSRPEMPGPGFFNAIYRY